ncbi:MAG: hypothetical protein ACTSU6_07460, partial [Candidatus Njordarchaeales archaeon]
TFIAIDQSIPVQRHEIEDYIVKIMILKDPTWLLGKEKCSRSKDLLDLLEAKIIISILDETSDHILKDACKPILEFLKLFRE